MQFKNIAQFSFWEFCLAVEDAIKQGYTFSTDNDKMPTAYVGNYSCVMIKQDTEAVVEAKVADTPISQDDAVMTAQQTQQKRGRKSTS